MNAVAGPDNGADAAAIKDRIRELEQIETELRLVANTDCPYAEYARNWLAALEEARDD
jgi:hypothetical protein